MSTIFHDMGTSEIHFRLDVIGCNPRYFRMRVLAFRPYSGYQKLIEETCEEILGCYETDVDHSHFKWVVVIVMQRIETASDGPFEWEKSDSSQS